MIMRKSLLLLVAILVSAMTFAGKVSEQQALQKARQFMQDKRFEVKALTRAQMGNGQVSPFYVFNVENNGGFVIVSGDDRTDDIIGYADKGHLSLENMPDNLKCWLDGYKAQIKLLNESKATSTRGMTRAAKAAVAPLIQSKWGQDDPYNIKCPKIPDESGEYAVTGSVATAMAQVMYYHKWPKDATAAIPEYTTKKWQVDMPALDPIVFDWNSMKNTYSAGETGTSVDAVANLMRYCGQAVEMNYGLASEGGSSANVGPEEMIQFFGYGKNAKKVYRCFYTGADWEDMIYKEVSENRPVLYSGQSSSGDHQFVCDGYDGNGYFHFNWGRSGQSDGYFVLSLANPSDFGIDGGTSSDGYSYWQDAIINLKPENGEATIPGVIGAVVAYKFNDESFQTEFTRASSSADFKDVELPGAIVMIGSLDTEESVYSIEMGWGLYQNGTLAKVLSTSNSIDFSNAYYSEWNNAMVSFGAGLSDGVYLLRQIYRPTGSTTWLPCDMRYWNTTGNNNKLEWAVDYISATISSNTLTIRKSDTEYFASDFDINSVSYSVSQFEVGKPVEVSVNLTNTSDAFQELLCFWYGDKYTLVCGSVEPGETGTVRLHFAPNASGSIPVKITTDAKGNNVIWDGGTISVSNALIQNLSCVATSPGLSNKVLYGTTLNVSADITNNGSNLYENKLEVDIFRYIEGQTSHPYYKGTTVFTSIEPGETKSYDFSVAGLDPNNKYFFYLFYYSAGNRTRLDVPGAGTVFSIEIPTSETITMSEEKITLCSNKNLDFSGTDDVKAYVVTGYDYDNQTIWLTRVKDVPAGTPILVKGTANQSYDVPVKATSDSYYKNMLVGNLSGSPINAGSTTAGMTDYYLKDGMFLTADGTNPIGNGKAYLQIPTEAPSTTVGSRLSVKLNAQGFASFCATQDMDFTDVEGLKAYAATGYDDANGTIWLSRVNRVSADTPLLLSGAADGVYTIPSAAVLGYYVNMLKGNTSGSDITIYTTADGMTNFYLKGNQLLKATAEGNKIGNGKAFMQIPSAHVTRSAEADISDLLVYNLTDEPEMISMPVMTRGLDGNGDATGIREVKNGEVKSEKYYNLQGQRVNNPSKGLYIKNGKVVVVR